MKTVKDLVSNNGCSIPELVNAGKELLAENDNPELFNQFTKEFDIVANTKLTDVYPELG